MKICPSEYIYMGMFALRNFLKDLLMVNKCYMKGWQEDVLSNT